MVIGAPPARAGTVSYVGALSVSGSAGPLEGPVAVSGQSLVAAATGGGYVFTEPTSGWGSEPETATLIDTNGAGVTPTDVAATSTAVVLNEDASPYAPPFE